MEKSDRVDTAQRENLDEAVRKSRSGKVSEYHFFIAKDVDEEGRELTGKDTKSGEKKEIEADQSVAFFLTD
jgi:hypothetical protein